jgi:hypothetical protein
MMSLPPDCRSGSDIQAVEGKRNVSRSSSRNRLWIQKMIRYLTLLFISLTLFQQPSQAAPASRLWEVWLASADTETVKPDHSYWQHFLTRHLTSGKNGVNLLDYAGALTELLKLKHYLSNLQAIPVSKLSRSQQRAYWINLYNAATVATILDHYPVRSIRDIDISPGLFADGPWDRKFLNIEGLELSLNDIEHRILRPIWKDNRLHYALNCASIGCPNLQFQAFTSVNSEELLESAASDYINHPRGANIQNGKLLVSSIYKWYQADFGNSEKGVIAHLKRYAKTSLLNQLKGINEIDDYQYDWSLNESKSAGKR